MKVIRGLTVVLFFGLVYSMGATMVHPWLRLPNVGDIPFTLLFTGFAVCHAGLTRGWRATAAFFVLAATISWCFEQVGVATGLIYGPYHYSAMLGAKLGYVPVVIPLAWFMMIYPAWCVARVLLSESDRSPFSWPPFSWPALLANAVTAAMIITAWDVVMDPGMAQSGNWIWERGGAYFGVPLRNYAGWLLTTVTIYLTAGLAMARLKSSKIETPTRWFAALPIAIYAWFAARYVVNEPIGAFRVIALFTMGFPALLALLRLLLTSGRAALLQPEG
jgi:uncharacterized membrane protein